MIAMAVTIIVLAGAMMMFMKSNDSHNMTIQMTEMQANARAAANSLSQDLSQAGTGLTGGIGLPSKGGAAIETFGVSGAYLNPDQFYNSPSNGITSMYGVTPAFGAGPTIGGQAMDGINIVYNDPVLSDTSKSNWALQTVNLTTTGGTTTVDATGLNPTITDPNTGLRVGDVVMFNGPGGQQPVAVVTAAPTGNTFVIAPGDPFNINQTIATSNNLTAMGTTAGGVTSYPANAITMMRLSVITYFLQAVTPLGVPIPLPAAGATDYRLMRQLNGQPAVPVAEHIDYLHFYYDLADSTAPPTTPLSHIPDAVEPAIAPNPAAPAYSLIRTVYVNLAARTAKPDKNGQYAHATINTAIGPQSLSFRNTYPPSGP